MIKSIGNISATLEKKMYKLIRDNTQWIDINVYIYNTDVNSKGRIKITTSQLHKKYRKAFIYVYNKKKKVF